jgi:hypothetical protein
VASETARYPPPDITPREFESFVAELLEAVDPLVEGLQVTFHDRIQGVDGLYDFDATVRFGLGGMCFLVVVEAKRHKNPIKRELVQVLHDKRRSVGAHKAAKFATAPYQRGALEYAKTHGIALVTVTEGRFTFETKAVDKPPTMSRQEAVVSHANRFAPPHPSRRARFVTPSEPAQRLPPPCDFGLTALARRYWRVTHDRSARAAQVRAGRRWMRPFNDPGQADTRPQSASGAPFCFRLKAVGSILLISGRQIRGRSRPQHQ